MNQINRRLSMGKITGRNAIVTGSARGIGKAIAEKLASEGASVVIADVDIEAAEATSKEISSLGVRSFPIKIDVSDYKEMEALIERTKNEWGSMDILVNNAGITRDNIILKMTPGDFDMVISINLKGVFNGIKAAFPIMMRQRSGKIVNIASIIGITGNTGQANYSASKGGVIALTKTAAKELAARGVTVNAIAPGFIQSAMTDKLPDTERQKILSRVPMGRIGLPEDVAKAALFLSSPDSDYITGQVLVVDGGMVMV
jgi:3-oxoacyl-[acyl-carrier protein] reductase